MFLSLSIAQDPKKFKWYKYKSKPITIDGTIGKDLIDLELKSGDVFGLYTTTKATYLAEPFEFDKRKPFQPVAISNHDAKRLQANSDGWVGKVGKIEVLPGEGQQNAIQAETDAGKTPGLFHLKMNSSVISRAAYSPKTKELFVVFKSGATWKYSKVTKEEAMAFQAAESQGRYFDQFIKDQKEAVRIDKLG